MSIRALILAAFLSFLPALAASQEMVCFDRAAIEQSLTSGGYEMSVAGEFDSGTVLIIWVNAEGFFTAIFYPPGPGNEGLACPAGTGSKFTRDPKPSGNDA